MQRRRRVKVIYMGCVVFFFFFLFFVVTDVNLLALIRPEGFFMCYSIFLETLSPLS